LFSPELETLDQLLACDMPLAVIAQVYPTFEHFQRGISGLLNEGDVVLLDSKGAEVPRWRWRQLFSIDDAQENLRTFRLRITPHGAKKVS
jgi:hypothetical protein